MKKAKRLAIIVCAIAMLMSILAIPASAATQDHYHTFSWEGTTRYAHVNTVWRKGDNSATYFRVTDNSMPVEGFYIRTTLAPYSCSKILSNQRGCSNAYPHSKRNK